jgi:hypothetical protein
MSNKMNDGVLRRALRQPGGGWLSNIALERSKQRDHGEFLITQPRC